MPETERLDTALAKRGLVPSRSRARALIEAGAVTKNGVVCTKCAAQVEPSDTLAIEQPKHQFVSRGGYKLLHAIEVFHLSLAGAVAMDIGASTGGFTDCMLQHGASRVYAVDVGTGQLDPALRLDPRVINLEQCNVRTLTREQVPEAPDFITADVSFISLTKILSVMAAFSAIGGRAVCLIKPQFEAGREHLSKTGVVRDPRVHARVIDAVSDAMIDAGFAVTGLTHSPIKGGDGNVEYLALLERQTEPIRALPADPLEIALSAHQLLKEGMT